jgi:hypothetical protein
MERKRKADEQLQPHMARVAAVQREMEIAGITLGGTDTQSTQGAWGPISSSSTMDIINTFEAAHVALMSNAFASAEDRAAHAELLTTAAESGIVKAAVDEFVLAHTPKEYSAYIKRYVDKNTLPNLVCARKIGGERQREWFILRVMMRYNAKLKRITTVNGHVSTFDENWHAQRMKDFDARTATLARMYKRHATYKGGRLHFECVD